MATQTIQQQAAIVAPGYLTAIKEKVSSFFSTLSEAVDPFLGPWLLDSLDRSSRNALTVRERTMIDANFMGIQGR